MNSRVAWLGITAGAVIMLSPFVGWLVTMPWDGEGGQQSPPERSPAWQAAYDACFEDNVRSFQSLLGPRWTRDQIPSRDLAYFAEKCSAYAGRVAP